MFVLMDVEGHPIQMVEQTLPNTFDFPVMFHPLARLCSRQRKHQPTLLMSEDVWEHLSDKRVTHEGAFGSDYHTIPKTKMREIFVDALFDPHSVRWVVVWKFPGDLNYLTQSGKRVFKKILNLPLPVGEYPLYDDGWLAGVQSLSAFPKNAMVEKMRTDVEHGESIHFLEDRRGVKCAMIGSHNFIRELWKVKPQEIKQTVAMIQALKTQRGIVCFPCYGQHHAIVFYEDKGSLITPVHLATLLRTTSLLDILNHFSYYDLTSWSKNVIRLASKTTFTSAVPPQTKVGKTHRQPHPTGSLLRINPSADSGYVSQRPVPNNASVEVLDAHDEFVLIAFQAQKGWVRSKYLF